MYGYVLQDWITLKLTAASSTIIQNESDWLGFSSFQDIVFWCDIRGVTLSAGTVTMFLQTAPTKDDILFQTLSNCSFVVTTVATPFTSSGVLPKSILAANPAVPLSTWVRWTITNTTANADITFRILCSANRVVSG